MWMNVDACLFVCIVCETLQLSCCGALLNLTTGLDDVQSKVVADDGVVALPLGAMERYRRDAAVVDHVFATVSGVSSPRGNQDAIISAGVAQWVLVLMDQHASDEQVWLRKSTSRFAIRGSITRQGALLSTLLACWTCEY